MIVRVGAREQEEHWPTGRVERRVIGRPERIAAQREMQAARLRAH